MNNISDKLQQLRIDDSPNGEWTCYGNVKGYIDSHGTLMANGSYMKSIPGFLKKSFSLDTHSAQAGYVPTLHNTLGFFVEAVEDAYGLYLVGQFHSTPFAQNIRQQLLERQAQGLSTGMSIGFDYDPENCIRIFPSEYETELPKWSQPQFLADNLERANKLPYVDIVLEVELVECSVTVIPSNEPSLISEIRTGTCILEKDDNNYTKSDLIFNNKKNMEDIRVAKKLGKASHEELSKHLDNLDDSHEKLGDHIKDATEEHRKLGKMCRDMRKKLDSFHKDDDDDKRDDKHEDDDKRSLSDLYTLLEEIKNKK